MSKYAIDLDFDNMHDPSEPYLLDGEAELDEWFDSMLMSVGELGHPCPAQLGPAGERPALLFGLLPVDGQTIHGMIRWLPTGEYGYAPEAPRLTSDLVFDGRFIDVVEDVVAYAPDATQVTGQQVMDAVREYVRTAVRPTLLRWRPGHQAISHAA